MEINRASIYYQPSDNDDVWLLNIIRDIWLQHTFFGYRKITAFLGTEYNIFVNKKRVQRLMKLAEISAVYPKPNLSKTNKEHRVHSYLLRNLEINKANLVWMTDLTYLKLNGRFRYR